MAPDLDAARRAAEATVRAAVAGGWDGQARAVFVVADKAKPSSAAAIAQLTGPMWSRTTNDDPGARAGRTLTACSAR